MAEKESPKLAEKKEEKQPSIWRWRKLLVTGLISAQLIFPRTGDAFQLKSARDPPMPYAEMYSSKYGEGWNRVMKAFELSSNGKDSRGDYDRALKYFEQKYKEEKNPETLYMVAYCNYAKVFDEEKYQNAEGILLRTIKICDIGIQKYNLAIFTDLKLTSFQNLGQIFSEIYQKYHNEEHRKKAVSYLRQYLSVYESEDKSGYAADTLKNYEKVAEESRLLLDRLTGDESK